MPGHGAATATVGDSGGGATPADVPVNAARGRTPGMIAPGKDKHVQALPTPARREARPGGRAGTEQAPMTNYARMYRLGMTLWEKYGTTAAASIAAVLDREERGRARPLGRALDLGCGRGQFTPSSGAVAGRRWGAPMSPQRSRPRAAGARKTLPTSSATSPTSRRPASATSRSSSISAASRAWTLASAGPRARGSPCSPTRARPSSCSPSGPAATGGWWEAYPGKILRPRSLAGRCSPSRPRRRPDSAGR